MPAPGQPPGRRRNRPRPGAASPAEWGAPLGRTPLAQHLAAADADSPERLRYALGLLRFDEGQADYLAQRLLTADPETVKVLRQELEPHAAAVTPGLWDVLANDHADAGQCLRVACALAVFTADDARWPAVAPTIVAKLVGENLLLVPRWTELLRPVGHHLVPPLATVFRDRQRRESERDLATDLLADFAAEQSDTLTDLLLDAEPRAYGVLLPKVKAHRGAAAVRLESELKRTLPPDWKDAPLEPAWEKPTDAVVRPIEAAAGMLHGASPSARRCRWTSSTAWRKNSAPAAIGRSVCDLTLQASACLVAALWARDGIAAETARGLAGDALRQRDAELRQQGYLPVDVAGYVTHDQGQAVDRYAAVWEKAAKGADDRLLFVGLPAGRFPQTEYPPLSKMGYGILVYHGFRTADRQVRHSVILWQPSEEQRPGRWAFHYDGPPDGFLPPHPGTVLRDVSVYAPPRLEAPVAVRLALAGLVRQPVPGLLLNGLAVAQQRHELAAGTWHELLAFEGTELHGLEPLQHLRRCRELAGQGWRPLALSVAVPETGVRVAASSWQRPVIPAGDQLALVHRQSRAAAGLLHLQAPESVWPLFADQPNPSLRHRPDPPRPRAGHRSAPDC